MKLLLRGRGVVPGRCEGEALVSRMPISFLGGVDVRTGVVVERGHDLEGECISGRYCASHMARAPRSAATCCSPSRRRA